MRAVRLATGGALVLLLAGCDYVASKRPVGDEPLPLVESEWSGAWFQGDGPVTVRVVDAEQGHLEVAWVEETGGEFVMETLEVFLRRHQDWVFASFAGVEDDQPHLLWSRLGRDQDRVFLWWPRPAQFKFLVEQGLLPGTIEGDDVLLEKLAAEHLSLIASEEHGVLFQWDDPMTFRRLR
jgi:hypothetical protein